MSDADDTSDFATDAAKMVAETLRDAAKTLEQLVVEMTKPEMATAMRQNGWATVTQMLMVQTMGMIEFAKATATAGFLSAIEHEGREAERSVGAVKCTCGADKLDLQNKLRKMSGGCTTSALHDVGCPARSGT